MFAFRQIIGGGGHETRRARHARLAIGVVRPVMLLMGLVASLANTIVEPGSVTSGDWTRLAVFMGVQVLLWGLLRTRLAIDVVFAIAVALDASLLAATLVLDQAPANGAITFIVLMIIVGYFVRPALAIAFGLVLAAVVAVIGPRLDDWSDPAPVPTISVAIFITALAMAYISSRMRADESRLEQLVREQESSLERLRVVDALRDQLIANVSHELRTPLTTTVGSIDTLLRTDIQLDAAQQRQLLTLARNGGLRLVLLVEDLLTLGSTRPDSLELMTRPEHLATIAREALIGIDPGEDRSIHFDPGDDPLVRVDRLRMLQVVTNLVVNAVNHGRGDIRIAVGRHDDHATISVLDEGDGVEQSHVDELFLPFAKFSTRPDSTGLGLAICRAIVEAHGGTIRYRRTDDEQTAFDVDVPVG